MISAVRGLLLSFFFLVTFGNQALAIPFDIVTRHNKVSIVYDPECKLDSIAANLLASDIELLSGYRPTVSTDIARAKGNVIIIGSIHSAIVRGFGSKVATEKLKGKWECYGYRIINNPGKNIKNALIICGSDFRGTAYGVFDLSARLGVSPWYWWADVIPARRESISIELVDFTSSTPSVKYRGIFINDEDWGLQPWAAKTFEPETGDIGPKTYAKIFELLLRLKANLVWPAMHPSTKAFFHYPGNAKTAEDYQIVIGSSHAEPMLRNNVGEWDEKTMGHFNYLTNKETVYKYWEDRIKESSHVNGIYTLGMRGVHDSGLEGIKDPKEAVPLVERIFKDQRELLRKYVNKHVTTIPQVLTVYKEVLDIYDNGLKVPDDVTLVWPDDNYGYIQRLNNDKERKRSGGSGVYYHASYWGRPHDYLWLSSTHPSLIREEMMKAYETGADKLWVLNVGDIKPLEYNIELFMDMAYNATPFKNSRYTSQHMLQWSTDIFGKENAKNLLPILSEYYQLAFERRPEFMGWSQTEPITKTTYTDFNHFIYGDEAQQRIDRYEALEVQVKLLRPEIAPKDDAAFYQLIYYPVIGASLINKKFLYRDKSYFYSKQNRLSAGDYAAMSKAAYDSIVMETVYFNNVLSGGKWKNIMSMMPRELPVYDAPDLPQIAINDSAGWSVAPEGFVTTDSSLVNNAEPMSLPAFDGVNRQKYFIDIYLIDAKLIEWTASLSHNWIRLSKNSGLLSPKRGEKQVRIWVDIDWSKMPTDGKHNGQVIFKGGDKQIVVQVVGSNLAVHDLANYKGFVENNGIVSMSAANFSRQINKHVIPWKVTDDAGYTVKSLQALPVTVKEASVPTDAEPIKKNNSFVEYDFYTFSSGSPIVTVFSLPTHPLNKNHSMRYAVSIDNRLIAMVDFRTFGRSDEWKQNVLKNQASREIQLQFLKPGKHTLRLYTVDQGVIVNRILINLGGLKKAYSTIEETKIRP